MTRLSIFMKIARNVIVYDSEQVLLFQSQTEETFTRYDI